MAIEITGEQFEKLSVCLTSPRQSDQFFIDAGLDIADFEYLGGGYDGIMVLDVAHGGKTLAFFADDESMGIGDWASMLIGVFTSIEEGERYLDQ